MFHLRYGLVVLLVVLMALGGFRGAEAVEKWSAGRARDGRRGGRGPRRGGGRMRRLVPWQWTLKSRLAVLALALGLVALFGGPRDGGTVTLNAAELAAIVESEVDHVTVDELADWIIQGRNDYRLLDVRDPAAYAEYHIPTAESVQITELADYPLLRNEKIVLYSDGGTHSAQAWFLLKARGYGGVYMLLYGLEEWKQRILFPSPGADGEPAGGRRLRARPPGEPVLRRHPPERRGDGRADGDRDAQAPAARPGSGGLDKAEAQGGLLAPWYLVLPPVAAAPVPAGAAAVLLDGHVEVAAVRLPAVLAGAPIRVARPF